MLVENTVRKSFHTQGRSILDVASIGQIIRSATQVVHNRTFPVAEVRARNAVMPSHTARENALLPARIVVVHCRLACEQALTLQGEVT